LLWRNRILFHSNCFFLVLSMKKKYSLIVTAVLFVISGFAQSANVGTPALDKHIQDSIKAVKDSIRWAKLEASAIFPLYNAGTWSGVIPVEGVDEIPDPKREYKLLFDFTYNKKDSTFKEINPGLVEIARIINLHVASGIPKDHIHPVVVVHAKALYSMFSNDAFTEKNKKDNPNIKLINEMMNNGVRFIACGQSMNYQGITKSQLYPGVKVSIAAKTALSNHVGQGYVLFDVNDLD
jgi:intracellular sulfur oxidation DsrE/DsrF family protein